MGLISVLLVAATVSVALTPVFASPNATENQTASPFPKLEIDSINYAASLGAKLRNSFPTVIQDGQTVILYPLEYAGCYIGSSHLHVVLSKYATNSTIDTYRSIMGDSDVIFETAEFPLSQLYAVQDVLDGVMVYYSIDATGVNESENRVEVHLHNTTKQGDVLNFLNNQFNDFDNSCITFLGPLEIMAGIGEVDPPMVTPDSNIAFFGAEMPVIYVAAAVAVVAVIVAIGGCYLVLIRYKARARTVES